MSFLNRVCTKAKQTVKLVGEKAEVLVDSAAKAMKIKSLELKLEEQYEKLGEIVYRDCHVDDDLEEERLAVMAAIDAIFDELAVLRGEDDTDAEACDSASEEEAAQ